MNAKLIKRIDIDSGKAIEVYEPSEGAKEIYIDGTEITLGTPISKLHLHTTEKIEEKDGVLVETRKLKAHIAIPTTGLIDLAASILSNVKTNEKSLIEAMDASKNQVANFVKTLAVKTKDKDSV